MSFTKRYELADDLRKIKEFSNGNIRGIEKFIDSLKKIEITANIDNICLEVTEQAK